MNNNFTRILLMCSFLSTSRERLITHTSSTHTILHACTLYYIHIAYVALVNSVLSVWGAVMTALTAADKVQAYRIVCGCQHFLSYPSSRNRLPDDNFRQPHTQQQRTIATTFCEETTVDQTVGQMLLSNFPYATC